MTPEERQMLAGLFERINATASNPRDPQAESFIDDAVRANPHAPYVLSQTVLVQQQALEVATKRLADLEAQLKAAPPQEETSFLGNLGKTLFGGGSSTQQAPPPSSARYAPDPTYQRQQGYPQAQPQAQGGPWSAPPQQGGPWGGQQGGPFPPSGGGGGGFLSNALTTAAGVAGGMAVAHALGGLFGGHSNYGLGGLGGIGGGLGGGTEVVNNYFETAPDASAQQRAQDALQDADQDQDDAQDAYDDAGDVGGGDDNYDT